MGNVNLRQKISDSFFCLLTDISPELNTRIRYCHYYKKRLNLKTPSSFTEKLLWLKLYDYASNALVKKCADKYAVREYIKDNGFEDILVPLLGVYDSPGEIDFESLPNQFALKWNFGCGYNIICTDRNGLDIHQTVQQLEKWGKIRYYRFNSEMQYKGVEQRIICESFLPSDEESGVIPDYKVYCFNGVPKAIFVMHDRGHDVKTEFFDVNWNLLENSKKYNGPSKATTKPECLDYMIEVSKKISSRFPFVRCDFYVVNGKLYFGEMTFTPAGGLYTSTTIIDGKDMGDLLQLPYNKGR